jgi:hypothetical protein
MKYRAIISKAVDPRVVTPFELAGGGEVEQEGMSITNKLAWEGGILPLSVGEPTYAVPIFHLK